MNRRYFIIAGVVCWGCRATSAPQHSGAPELCSLADRIAAAAGYTRSCRLNWGAIPPLPDGRRVSGTCSPRGEIVIQRGLDGTVLLGTVAHELIHANIPTQDHGPRFVAECRRIAPLIGLGYTEVR